MPAKGKHRRPKSQRFTRSIAVAGTGGAALALPLMGAAGAHAAAPQSAPEKAVQSAPAAEKKAAEKATGARAYTVKAGDYLAKIADDQNVSGGWKKLYADNRDAVGSDPSLIHPGLKLSIGKKAATGEPKASAPSSPKSSSKSSASKSSASESSSKADSAAKPAAAKPAAEASNGFSLPVDGASVGTPYHMSGSMWSSGYHTGVDFVVPTGTSLKAVGAGTVVSAGWGGAYGNQVVVQLEDGKYAQYAHLSSLSVSAGQTVTAGQQVGLSGATGNVTGPHLHFEIRTTPDYGSDVDPVAYLRSHGVSVG
jgi:murein DD-endopeptidase MepM/ murein hydrolase activator NlpD